STVDPARPRRASTASAAPAFWRASRPATPGCAASSMWPTSQTSGCEDPGRILGARPGRLKAESALVSGRNDFYQAGGCLRREAPSYVVRWADEELYEALLAGEFCYVLTAR